MHRLLIASLRYLNLRFVYLGMALFVVPFYMLLARRGYRSMYHYFRLRHGYGAVRSFCGVYLNHYRFGQVIIDRFAAYAGRRFQMEPDGYSEFERAVSAPQGIVILSCHVGNYELAGYTFRSTEKRYSALVYSGEAQAVMENRQRLLQHNNMRMIPVSSDMSHVFVLNEALANGEIVSIPADRLFGSPRYVECDFLGSKARFPLGPYALALQREAPTLALFVMKESAYRYKVYIRRIEADPLPYKNRKEQAANLAQHFAYELETILRKYPEQWFNYYEFWNHDRQ